MLRHASITTTSDLYTNVLPELARSTAEATARMIPRAKINVLGRARAAICRPVGYVCAGSRRTSDW
jgi:hypothetical protein